MNIKLSPRILYTSLLAVTFLTLLLGLIAIGIPNWVEFDNGEFGLFYSIKSGSSTITRNTCTVNTTVMACQYLHAAQGSAIITVVAASLSIWMISLIVYDAFTLANSHFFNKLRRYSSDMEFLYPIDYVACGFQLIQTLFALLGVIFFALYKSNQFNLDNDDKNFEGTKPMNGTYFHGFNIWIIVVIFSFFSTSISYFSCNHLQKKQYEYLP